MNYREKKTIFKKLCKKGFAPSHVAEVGVYHPETSNIYDYVQMGVKTTFVEPNMSSIELIKKHFSGKNNITLHEVAIYDRNEKIKLVQREASTFLSFLATSPAIVNDEYIINDNDLFEVTAKRFDEIDDGTIDLLSVDVEGSEWYVIKNLVSRPAVISVETHGALYSNPNLEKITGWMKNNDYIIWYKDRSDTVYVKKGMFNITIMDKIKYLAHEVYLKFRTYKKLLKKKSKK